MGCVDLRECPRCGTAGAFSRAESLDQEEEEMKELSLKLASIRKDAGDALLEEAREIILRLRRANQRWNILELDDFLNQKQKELSVGYRRRPVYAD